MASRQVSLSADVDALTGAKIEEDAPIAGTITQILLHFPSGPNSYAKVAFGHTNTWICPAKPRTYIALDYVSPIFDCNEPVEKGEKLWLIILNGDDLNTHKISAVITIVS